MTDDFYRAFEDKHRGSRELIKERLTAYAPFLKGILSLSEQPEAIDFGCGRGEWLEYIQSLGFKAQGVDLDENMLEACQGLGLSVKKGEMIEFIRNLQDESCLLVSGFHVVEHISFDDLKVFTEEALRVLQPGGLLIMETPNPENIMVATRDFYLDPTHKKPIPPELLRFLTEHSGFDRSKIVRLQESPKLRKKSDVSIADVFVGVSPDYAIVAQKGTSPELMAKLCSAFEHSYGLSLDNLLGRWEKHFSGVEHTLMQVESRVQESSTAYETGLRWGELQTKAEEAQRRTSEGEQKIDRLEGELSKLRARLSEIQSELSGAQAKHENSEKYLAQASEKISQLERTLEDRTVREATTQGRCNALEERLTETEVKLLTAGQESNSYSLEVQEYKQELEKVRAANHQHWAMAQELQNQLDEVHSANHQHWAQLQECTQELDRTTQRLSESLANAHNYHLRATTAEQRVFDIQRSTSWRITSPLRGVRKVIDWLLALPIRVVKAVLRPVVSRSMRHILRKPTLRHRAINFLRAYPRLYAHLRQFALNRGMLTASGSATMREQAKPALSPHPTSTQPQRAQVIDPNLSGLTPRARRIYNELLVASEEKKGPQ